jgi:hypothetical protein
MASGFSTLIQEIHKIIPSARGEGGAVWKSGAEEHRELIRESMRSSLGGGGFNDSPPRPKDWSVSISHCRSFGGWLAVPRPHRIGFDAEESSRVQVRIVERVCSRQEIAECPDPAYLWSAKEAYFKALEHEQPQTITELTVRDWMPMGSGIFHFAPEKNMRGILIEDAGLYYCACIRVSI